MQESDISDVLDIHKTSKMEKNGMGYQYHFLNIKFEFIDETDNTESESESIK